VSGIPQDQDASRRGVAMFQLVYVSAAVRPLSKSELGELLAQSRKNNSRLGLTGMLLYKDGDFMQVLEGEEQVVRDMMSTIARDPRHSGILVLIQGDTSQHPFAEWSMGFRDLNSPEARSAA
jgi:hypothetical protein